MMWKRREIENYFCTEDVLLSYAISNLQDDIFGRHEEARRLSVMKQSIVELTNALKVTKQPAPWAPDIKATDQFLDPLFENYFEKLGLPCMLRKGRYFELIQFLKPELVDLEIREKLDLICKVLNG